MCLCVRVRVRDRIRASVLKLPRERQQKLLLFRGQRDANWQLMRASSPTGGPKASFSRRPPNERHHSQFCCHPTTRARVREWAAVICLSASLAGISRASQALSPTGQSGASCSTRDAGLKTSAHELMAKRPANHLCHSVSSGPTGPESDRREASATSPLDFQSNCSSEASQRVRRSLAPLTLGQTRRDLAGCFPMAPCLPPKLPAWMRPHRYKERSAADCAKNEDVARGVRSFPSVVTAAFSFGALKIGPGCRGAPTCTQTN